MGKLERQQEEDKKVAGVDRKAEGDSFEEDSFEEEDEGNLWDRNRSAGKFEEEAGHSSAGWIG